ncbi:carbon-nitrogen hydrolase family protein [Streptomyces albogriseolus]|uniref:carbon-nitrogen hydrolase family protein n=1 Tax=Streptomyces albogriseolus TaxID=1887 RepID=UPI00224E86D0|nr:carbon-nitrogen hydrolase family protein [Streptomyces viridodiastaticus]MCX4624476.1 carbon-nitrogen hydrolase family protein [Streptomyces viridodiastaticus]
MTTTSAPDERPSVARTLRLAVAQSTVPEDPTDRGALRAAGQEIRALMVEAAEAGARLVQFPEGAVTYPSKHVMAAGPAGELVPADWSRAAWDVLREEAESITVLAGRLGLWTVFGSIHPLTPPNRPHNSLYVVSDRGQLVARYDKRFLSHTEVSYLYSPGHQPLVVEVDGIRFGFALCIEANFPEVFAEYERLDVNCVLLSVMVDDAPRARVAQAYGTLYNYWVGYSVPSQFSATVPSGIVAPGGRWLAQCPADGQPALAVADIDLDSADPDIDVALRYARPWRRRAQEGLYEDRLVDGDPRSNIRTAF